MNNQTNYYFPKVKSIFAPIACVLFFGVHGIGQRSVNTARGEIILDSIELCFGYSIKKCVFDQDIYGYMPKNYSRLRLDTDDKGKVESIEILYNSNHSLEIEDFKKCIIPYIELSAKKYKRRYEVIETKEISIIFEDDISAENEYYRYMNYLNSIKIRSINFYRQNRKDKSVNWDQRVDKFNRIVVSEDADSIFFDLDTSLNLMIKSYLDEYNKGESKVERINFSNKTQTEFDNRIHHKFMELLKDYFDND